MAQQQISLDRKKFCCWICVELLKDPVTIPCGHTYCRSCIQSFWDEEDQKKIPSCPQCKQTFIPRSVLVKNNMLAHLAEDLEKTGLQDAPAEPEDVACDLCTGRKLKAHKFCLICLAYYCKKHLQPHYDAGSLKKHELVEPCEKLQENICSHHDEVMKTHERCVCYLCSVDHHEGHNAVPAVAKMTKRQRKLEVSRKQIQQRIKDTDKKVKALQQEVEAIYHSADQAVEDNEKRLTQMISLIEKISSDTQWQIRSQQKTEVSRVKELQEKLEQEIAELKKKDAELQQLSSTQD
ncbi:E3 ubiquitin/ISG15 ligase TRIM25-like [Thalassophryne amazonica]|uniref:E3 ubiquitin/ISG15 ligase TRIM25-like n=1 Tax=Thalassophryne amazonica TaxID=390379 RepID=UPI0014716755|nr:E3 ubiquitin/ISG15 ligase TRIM25-like [Thalassophryne amazonica]